MYGDFKLYHPIWYFSTVDSTMDIGWRMHDALVHGLTIVAAHQTKGRGRLSRQWDDISGKSMLMTVFFHTSQLDCTYGVGHYSARSAYAVVRLLQHITKKQFLIKWPNDVLIKSGATYKKVAGILLEHKSDWLAIGVGLNMYALPPDCHTFASTAFSDVAYMHPLSLAISFVKTLWSICCCAFPTEINNFLLWKDKQVCLHAGKVTHYGVCRKICKDGGVHIEHSQGSTVFYTGSLLAVEENDC